MSRICENVRFQVQNLVMWRAYMSCRSLGPSAGSYSPSRLGRLRSSSRTGFTMRFTEMRRTSWVERKENERLATVDGIEFEGFISSKPSHVLWMRRPTAN